MITKTGFITINPDCQVEIKEFEFTAPLTQGEGSLQALAWAKEQIDCAIQEVRDGIPGPPVEPPPVTPPLVPGQDLTYSVSSLSTSVPKGQSAFFTITFTKHPASLLTGWGPSTSVSWLWLTPAYHSQNTLLATNTLKVEARTDNLQKGINRGTVYISTALSYKSIPIEVIVL